MLVRTKAQLRRLEMTVGDSHHLHVGGWELLWPSSFSWLHVQLEFSPHPCLVFSSLCIALGKQSCPSHTFILIVFIPREICPSILNRACCSCDNSVAFYKSKWCIVVITMILNLLLSIKILILN